MEKQVYPLDGMENMDILAVTTASDSADISRDKNAGFTILYKMNVQGRKPYLHF